MPPPPSTPTSQLASPQQCARHAHSGCDPHTSNPLPRLPFHLQDVRSKGKALEHLIVKEMSLVCPLSPPQPPHARVPLGGTADHWLFTQDCWFKRGIWDVYIQLAWNKVK